MSMSLLRTVCLCILFKVCPDFNHLSFAFSVFSVRVDILSGVLARVHTHTKNAHVDQFKSFMPAWAFACMYV